MSKLDQPKKTRLHHPDLVNIPPEDRQRERQRRWLANEKLDPERANQLKEQNTAKKREWRARKKLEKESNRQTTEADCNGHPPQKRRRITASDKPLDTSGPYNTPDVTGPSNPVSNDIPIDPALLGQEVTSFDEPLDTSGPSNTPDATGPSRPASDDITIDIFERVPTTTSPCLTRDVEVMTEDLSPVVELPSPPNDTTLPSPTLSALTIPHFRDLATSIIGSQVHGESKTVEWSDGSTTVLPCIMRDGINICQDDADTVSYFATLPESLPETAKNVIHLQYSDWHLKSRQLCDEISAALRVNKAVVIRQITTPEPATLDLDYLEDRGMSDLMRVVVHGESVSIHFFF
jgi:hypothetical protein